MQSTLLSLIRTLAKASIIRGAKRGANTDRRCATSSDTQPQYRLLDDSLSDARRRPATVRMCLLSSGSRVRILPGAPGQRCLGLLSWRAARSWSPVFLAAWAPASVRMVARAASKAPSREAAVPCRRGEAPRERRHPQPCDLARPAGFEPATRCLEATVTASQDVA